MINARIKYQLLRIYNDGDNCFMTINITKWLQLTYQANNYTTINEFTLTIIPLIMFGKALISLHTDVAISAPIPSHRPHMQNLSTVHALHSLIKYKFC